MVDEKSDKSVQTAEQGLYYPPRDLVENSNVMAWMKTKGLKSESEMREWCSKNYIQFWDEMAQTYADWFEPYKQTLQWKAPFAKWFMGGKINVAYNAVDRHATSWRRNKLAYIFVGEPVGDVRKITYFELSREVNRFANALKAEGIKKGDRVGIYLPMIPELPVAMLACAKLGAIHVVVFSGFSAVAIRDRLEDCQPKILVTCDGSYRRGKPIATKPQADEAIAGLKCIEKVVVVKRNGQETPMTAGRDVWWNEFIAGQSGSCETLPMDSCRSALHPLHCRSCRKAARHSAHPRRNERRPGVHYVLGLRHQGYGCLLVYRRYRMDHRPQLHRLRATVPGRHKHHVRGLARLSRLRPVV